MSSIDNLRKRAQLNREYGTNFGAIGRNKPCSNNTTGVTGVAFRKDRGTVVAYISVHGKRIHLGSFPSLKAAVEARKRAEAIYHQPLIDQLKGENTP